MAFSLGILTLLESEGVGSWLLLIAVFIFGLKGIVLPKLRFRSLRTTNVRQEETPIASYTASIVLGIFIVILSFWLTSHISLPIVSPLVLPVALSTLLSGLLLIVIRRSGIIQVIGYLVMENGIFVFGLGLAHEHIAFIEIGISWMS